MTFESDAKIREGPSGLRPSDRKLGDEWEDWDGSTQEDAEEPKGRFLLLASLVFLGFVGFLVVAAYLVHPRILQWPDQIKMAAKVAFALFSLGACALYVGFLLETTTKLRLLPYGWSERILLWLLPKTVWVGRRFGLSRDQVYNSFIKVNNVLSRSHTHPGRPRKLLILLPRCLSKETRQEIKKIMEGRPHAIATAGGGEEARKAIRKEKPDFIIALACERDLASGIRDVALKVPVIGIPNKRPEGPCKNTFVDLQQFREALEFFEANSGGNHQSPRPEGP